VSEDQFDAGVDGEFEVEEYGLVSSMTSPPSVHYVNESGLPDDEVLLAIKENREIASQIERWTQQLALNEATTPTMDVFRRDRWEGKTHIHARMSMCAWAVENDDVLSTTADVIEAAAFQKCGFEVFDEDEQQVWNQWAADVDLDSRLREQYRELFKCSNVFVGVWWEKKIYQVKDDKILKLVDDLQQEMAVQDAEKNGLPAPKAPPKLGNRSRRRKFPLEVPVAFSIFDPTKVVPVGTLMFGRERFAYIATAEESYAFGEVMVGNVPDATVMKLIERKYTPTETDRRQLAEIGVDTANLWLFREDAIFRHSLTRAQYERYAVPRLLPALPIIDMKTHLRNSDRSTLIGSTNFIVVITKGSDKFPAKQSEVDNLKEQARVLARLPVLVGDHRLNVEIVSPNMDNTLIEGRWQVLDSRLVFMALRTFHPVVQGGGSVEGVKEMSQVVSQGLSNRRHQLVRAWERQIFRKIMERNPVLSEEPRLVFRPRRITLDYSNDILTGTLKLRDRGDISRETTLDEMDYDQDMEVARRAKEKLVYDKVFSSSTPFSSPATNPYGQQPGQPGGQPGQPGQVQKTGTGAAIPAPAGTSPEGGRPPGVKGQTGQ